MLKENTLVLNRTKANHLTAWVFISGLILIVPMFHNQLLTGPIINATLLIATEMLGLTAGIFLGLLPSVIALAVGLLPTALSPLVPFIMVSNALMLVIFSQFSQKNYWLRIGLAGLIKFIFLAVFSSLAVSLVLDSTKAVQASLMLSWPQLITAWAGGIMAFGVLKFLKSDK